MAITLKLLSVAHPTVEDIVEIWFQIIPTGNYTTVTGDTLNLASLAGQISANEGSLIDADVINNMPIGIHVDSQTGGWGASGGGYYELQLYTNANPPTPLTPATCKLRIFTAGGAEQGTGAYPATVLNDYIVCVGRWPRKP
jgi:hypothetical protein